VVVTPDPSARRLAALLAIAGTTHFLAPEPYDAIVPRSLPGSPRFWTYASGACELATAVAIAVPRTRRLGGLAAAGVFVAALPANIKMALDWRDKPAPMRALAYARLPVQVPLIRWGLKVARVRRP
jgi:uncharacterized membrane protein